MRDLFNYADKFYFTLEVMATTMREMIKKV